MPEGPIRMLGEYDIDVQLHGDVVQTIKLSVVAQ
jgi:large subunit ribosomal protein L9